MTTDSFAEIPAEPAYAPSDVIAILDQVAAMVGDARQVPLTANIVINQAQVLELIENAREALPDDLVRADQIVKDASVVLDRADAEAQQTMGDAENYANQVREAADTYSDQTRAQADGYASEVRAGADQQAAEIEQRAKTQAQGIIDQTKAKGRGLLEEAKNRANELIAQETVYREAQARAEATLAAAQEEARRVSAEYHEYVAGELKRLEDVAAQIAHKARAGREKVGKR